tara:strand:- start:12 stop:374 length:363 start_codon:yes stop_codon:yes gene_type:complete
MVQTKEYMKEYKAEYYLKNKKHRLEQQKQYYLEHKEKIEQYRQTENYKKLNRISGWKFSGVISNDFNLLHDKYINTNNCEECNVELIHGNFGNNKKCLDHCHKSGEFRNILCCGCNTRRG